MPEDDRENAEDCAEQVLSQSITEVIHADTIIFKGRCLLHSVYLASDGAAGLASVYAGLDTSARKVVTLTNVSDGANMWMPRYPQVCEQGLYIDMVAATDYATVEWEPLSKKARY